MAPDGIDVVWAEEDIVVIMSRSISEFQRDRRESHIDLQGLLNEVKDASNHKHQMGIFEAIQTYLKNCEVKCTCFYNLKKLKEDRRQDEEMREQVGGREQTRRIRWGCEAGYASAAIGVED